MDTELIRKCKIEIEKRLGWGSSVKWTNQDFELLVEDIFIKTGTNLSLTTLKRIWGKVNYQSNPSVATLNALAQYLDYVHWRDFQNNCKAETKEERKNHSTISSISMKRYFNQKIIVVLVVLIALLSLYFLIDRRQVFYVPEDVVFQSKKVSTGLPNKVIFEYDISNVIADSFHIQQSWDQRRRIRISPNDTKHTSFYYFPGFFHAKLIANSEVIKEHEVFVESDGWAG
ncbi:MAG: hypothetical protein KAQ62_11220, partial [Cyclobacteriaceae bacterium]|nr:hypothetical protein [Cyclobacteriaceae bacterium]